MGAGTGIALVQIQPQRRLALRSEPRAAGILRTQDIAERGQCRDIEADAGVEIGYPDSDMVIHGRLHSFSRVQPAKDEDDPSQCSARLAWKILRFPRAASRKAPGETPAARGKVRTKLERSANPTSRARSVMAAFSSA